MNVKGFILEDDDGREFVMVCEKPYLKLGRTFSLRGWQRRRLVPMQYSERELRQIVAKVLIVLDELFRSLPSVSNSIENSFSHGEGPTTAGMKNPLVLEKVGKDGNCLGMTK